MKARNRSRSFNSAVEALRFYLPGYERPREPHVEILREPTDGEQLAARLIREMGPASERMRGEHSRRIGKRKTR